MLDLLQIASERPIAGSEAAFYQHWMDNLSGVADPVALAVQGGAVVERFGYIFSAGYQAAIRYVFAEEDFPGWVAFAVSEDRSEQNPLPGVISDGAVLNGYKTWIAASAVCDHLIISAKDEKDVQYFRLDTAAEEVSVETKPPGRMLPDLSQGRANLRDAQGQPLDASRVKSFQPAEVLFIYIAFLASTWRRFTERRTQVESLLENAQAIANGELGWHERMLQLDAEVQALLQDMRAKEGEADEYWRRDYKLIAMYSRQNSRKDSKRS